MSILHQVWSWVSGLMSQMLSRRQPIYRPVCTVDVTSGASAVHQSPASQRRWSSAAQRSACLPETFHLLLHIFTRLLLCLGFFCWNAAEIPLRALMLVLLYKLHFKRAQRIIKITVPGLKFRAFLVPAIPKYIAFAFLFLFFFLGWFASEAAWVH